MLSREALTKPQQAYVQTVPPPVGVACTPDPRWATGTSAGPSPSLVLAHALGRGSACARTRTLALVRSAPCPQSRGGGDGGGDVYGLWTGHDPWT